MTDKEKIIIDGVDVSKCCYAILPKNQCPAKMKPYAKETSCVACKQDNTKLNFCKNNPNCYFKQKVRKEQECEKLKEENEELNKKNNFLLQRLEVDDTETSLVFKLQRELENSKSEFYHAVVTNVKLKNHNQQLDGAITKLKCYEQALDEIEKYCNYKFCDKFGEFTELINKNSILDIINKTKDGKNE